MLIERRWAMPNRHTFRIKPIRNLIKEELPKGVIIDPFAGEHSIKRIMSGEQTYISNDIDPAFATDHNLDALDFLKMFETETVDMVLFDPPYSGRQVKECYTRLGKTVTMSDTNAGYWGRFKREIKRVVKVGGKVITCGWNSGGIGKIFKIKKVLLVPHGSWHNDTICVVDIKIQGSLQRR